MVTLDEIRFHVPCMANKVIGYDQLRCRIDNGFIPLIKVAKPLSDEELAEIDRIITKNNVRGASFDVGNDIGEFKTEYFRPLIESIASLVSGNDRYAEEIGIKFGSALPIDQNYGLRSAIDLDTFDKAMHKINIRMGTLERICAYHGLRLAFENRPRPNYGFFWDGKGNNLDRQPRWGGMWSAEPNFIGSMFASSQEMMSYRFLMQNFVVSLDLEHLAQTCQWGNIYNLEIADNHNTLRFADLTEEQRSAMRNCGLEHDDSDVLFDYSGLDHIEQQTLELFGFVLRKGQPLVYARQLFLEDEAFAITDTLPVISITPGFQVYQGITYETDSGKRTIIGSHMPGLQSRYIKDDNQLYMLSRQLPSIHGLAWLLMKRNGILDVELEIQPDDGRKVVYDGLEWASQAEIAKKQMKNNFSLAEQGSPLEEQAPYYFRRSSRRYGL